MVKKLENKTFVNLVLVVSSVKLSSAQWNSGLRAYWIISIQIFSLRLGVHKGMEWNGKKIIIKEWNEMYLSKEKEWKRNE